MAAVEKISIAVTPEIAATMRNAIQSGEYASETDVMREALRDWRFRRLQYGIAVEELRALWDEGINSGPAEDGEVVFARIRADLKTRLEGPESS